MAFWVGMGNSGFPLRTGGLVVVCALLAVFPAITERLIFAEQSADQTNFAIQYLRVLIPHLLIGVLIAGMFAGMRPWLRLGRIEPEAVEPTARMQFSVFHMLVLMSFVAVVLSLSRAARGDSAENDDSLQWWAANALGVLIFFGGTACAALAALGISAVERKSLLVLAASVLLGVAIAFSLNHDQFSGWVFTGAAVAMAVPTAGALAALLWVRPCGYRLVRRQKASDDRQLTKNR
jgi:hypothetical protein